MLSTHSIVVGSAVVLGLTVCTMVTLLMLFWGERPNIILDVIRTSASVGMGTGGGAALLLAARKQRATELDVEYKEHDATEARITELYGRAADQLGSDKAPVRLAGIFALERLAANHPAHRQTIVDLICAYLRMPQEDHGQDHPQEKEVRQSATTVLSTHLRSDDTAAFWPGIALNLAGATLHTFTFTRCTVRSATFAGAVFAGPAVFRGATFDQHADFRNVRFTGLADFRRVEFGGEGANFRGARFEGEVDFGQHTTAVLTGAMVREKAGIRRKWPRSWVENPVEDAPGWADLVTST